MSIEDVVRGINEALASQTNMKIGEVIQHPDGYPVKVIDGAFLRNGRVSNAWSWRRVRKNGTLGKLEHGYGW